jgi:uncharacterized membrane protein YgdD (TMEM256/DUF423 family)
MKLIEFFGITFSLLSVIFGAFGAHLLKKSLPESALQSFEVGIRYMMYHGLVLLILSLMQFEEKKWVAIFFIIGTLLFSVSIFFLSIQSILKTNLKWLGPVTPIGGTFLIMGWILFLLKAVFS